MTEEQWNEHVKVTEALLKAYQKQVEVLKDSQWSVLSIFLELCNNEDYRDWLLNNPLFKEDIANMYGRMATEKLLKKSSTDSSSNLHSQA